MLSELESIGGIKNPQIGQEEYTYFKIGVYTAWSNMKCNCDWLIKEIDLEKE